MKISIQNVVRSPYFIGAVLGCSVPIIAPLWLGATLPFLHLIGYLSAIAGPGQFGAMLEILSYQVIIPTVIIGWLIFKKLGFARPGLISIVALVGTMAVTSLIRSVLPSSVVDKLFNINFLAGVLVYAMAGLLFTSLAIKLVTRIRNTTHVYILVALLILVPIAIAELMQFKISFFRGY